MCGNSGEAFVHRRKQNTDRSTEDSDWKCFSSGERPLHGGVYQKIAPAPGKPISPEENIQNVGRTPAKPPFTGGNDKWRVLPVAATAVYNGTERL